jgi:thiol-disulfide isomerase/thioredoxin
MANRVKKVGMAACLILACLLVGCSGSGGSSNDSGNQGNGTIDSFETFDTVDGDTCRENGKPVIRMFSTTWCSHCQWVSDTFDDVVQTYVDEGMIVAHHWELDTGDDTLTASVEQGVPDTEIAVFDEFDPDGYVPAFVFGCKYYRIGTGYEQEEDLEAEAAEFMAVIEALLDE